MDAIREGHKARKDLFKLPAFWKNGAR